MIIVVLVIVLFTLIIPNILAIKIKCNNDGSVSIKDSSKKADVLAQVKASKDPFFLVSGKWKKYEKSVGLIKVKRYKFESKEGVFVQGSPTKYYLKVGTRRYTITCPAFVFACNILNTTIESCYMRNNTFYSKFFIENIPLIGDKVLRFGSPYGLEYRVWLEDGSNYVRSPEKYRDEFKEIIMTQKKLKKGNKYKFIWNATKPVERFSMFYNCEKGNFFEEANCEEMPTCRYSGDCKKNEYCEEEICQELDCEECEYASNHICEKQECCESNTCGNEEECNNNKCVSLNCTEAEIVQDHQCTSLDCAEDEYTINHACIKLDCTEYEHAINHGCEILNCKDDEKIENHQCKKLDCGWTQKPIAHDCVNFLYYNYLKSKDKSETE